MPKRDDYIRNISVEDLFKEQYEIPVYQRNYSWGSKQIEQLIDDILDIPERESKSNSYYIGTLIVNHNAGKYEVVDGQQRLTTLFLLMSFLNMNMENTLRFEAREQSNRLMREIHTSKNKENLIFEQRHEICVGYETIKTLFESKLTSDGSKIQRADFCTKLKKVHIVRVQVPERVDLNHYFEIMNTRGEQLELHEIAKSKLLTDLTDNERVAASMIWEACANMDSYVHMGLPQKKVLLSEDRDALAKDVTSFDDIVEKLSFDVCNDSMFTLSDFLEHPDRFDARISSDEPDDDERGSQRFESIIGFSQFLLHVNAAICKSEENESSLDDKRLLSILADNWSSAEHAKNFLFQMLRYRLLFDKYIIKRDKKIHEDGRWSLMRPKKYAAKNSVYYVGTFNDAAPDDEEINEVYFSAESARNLLTLQSALRVTYTSPKTMHWITVVLNMCSAGKDSLYDLLQALEDYSISKALESGYSGKTDWTDYQRIIFTYTDYLLFRDGYSYRGKEYIKKQPDFVFQFRSSIEHFYPQHPINNKPDCPTRILNSLGNLALISISGNSKVSNLDPVSKKKSYGDVIEQSLKLSLMASLIGDDSDEWINLSDENANPALVHEHEIVSLLDAEAEEYLMRMYHDTRSVSVHQEVS